MKKCLIVRSLIGFVVGAAVVHIITPVLNYLIFGEWLLCMSQLVGMREGPLVIGEGTGMVVLETLDHALAVETEHRIVARYAGDDRFTGSGGSVTRANPVLAARVTGTTGKRGWHTGPVTITYTCSEATAPLTQEPTDPTPPLGGAVAPAEGTEGTEGPPAN